jgi:hypothetical protein
MASAYVAIGLFVSSLTADCPLISTVLLVAVMVGSLGVTRFW